MKLALAGIVKNEAPYLLDWVAWHRAIGFTYFIIADNDSTDGTDEILRGLERAGFVRRLSFPGRWHKNPQMDAYDHICKRTAGRFDWVAFIDADEFILPASPENDLPRLLAGMPGDTGAVALNWALYGSSRHRLATEESILTRFTRRAAMHEEGNRHYKTILRPEAYERRLNSHHFRLRQEYQYRRANGTALAVEKPGISADVEWAPFRLNHYVIKSWAEFCHKKLPRGLADQPHLTRSVEFFHRHDLNEEEERVPEWLLHRFEAEKRAMLAGLDDVAAIARKALEELIATPPPAYQPPSSLEGEQETPIPRQEPSKPWRKLRRAWLDVTAAAARRFGLDRRRR
ncbi:glycosyltransferase family 2 protein [Acetobacteraceae bacterium H6797]|nr:glycosyltransferase family 2 protein [Acetobacteraceae bacterium H6797]